MACDIGVYGMATMGLNLSLNIADKGFKVAICNRSPEKVDYAIKRSQEENLTITATKTPQDFVNSLKSPKTIVMMVQAGVAVDNLLAMLIPLLEKGDILIDAGNELYTITEKRLEQCKAHGLLYLGLGVSGGEEGARYGPSLMAGGCETAYTHVKEILQSIAAKIDPKGGNTAENTCVAYLGSGGAGHFVKMVHNGIEYGIMQLLAETYNALKLGMGYDNQKISDTFAQWDSTRLQSYLLEISTHVLKKKTPEGQYLIDLIVDASGSKGTGKWTVQEAAELGVAVPTISSALESRYISSYRALRAKTSRVYSKVFKPAEKQALLEDIEKSLYVSTICSYMQGMHLLAAQSEHKQWNLDLSEVARIWKGGCIIRAKFLDNIQHAYKSDPKLEHLFLDSGIQTIINSDILALDNVLKTFSRVGAFPSMSASLQYVYTFISYPLPSNLIQAQRDYFGAHTFQRTDKNGVFHEENWCS